MTAFGFKGNTGGAAGLVGHIYDLKKTSSGQPTDIQDGSEFKNPHLLDYIVDPIAKSGERWKILAEDSSKLGNRDDLISQSLQSHVSLLEEFFSKNWDENVLKRYFQSKEPVTSFQFFIPKTSSEMALKAFGAEKDIKPTNFLIHYKGYVRAPRDGEFRFRMVGHAWVRFGDENVVGANASANDVLFRKRYVDYKPSDLKDDVKKAGYEYNHGKWFKVQAGKRYCMEVLMDDGTIGFNACLMIEEKNPEKPYSRRYLNELYPEDAPAFVYPVFALVKGIPIPPYNKERPKAYRDDPVRKTEKDPNGRPWELEPEAAPEPLIFPGVK